MDRWLQIILLMPEDDFITNKQLSETLGVSNRTIYNDITQLNQMMKDKGAQLISKPHYGVKLEVTDKGKYLAFLRSLEVDTTTAGDNSEARMNKIIEKLILLDEPIRMDDLSDELYISRSTLKTDLKRSVHSLAAMTCKSISVPMRAFRSTVPRKTAAGALRRLNGI